jgi:hypothetical protein
VKSSFHLTIIEARFFFFGLLRKPILGWNQTHGSPEYSKYSLQMHELGDLFPNQDISQVLPLLSGHVIVTVFYNHGKGSRNRDYGAEIYPQGLKREKSFLSCTKLFDDQNRAYTGTSTE